jgi:hypothetical protein
MARTSTALLVDRLIPGGLEPFLRSARDGGETFNDIAFRLRAEHDIKVTEETVRRWCGSILGPKASA